ncbi:MAG: nitroreductase family protein [Euryarchaeota archaeon]|nr:nitroreductase family protein [Euryarchaeota archaeon]
MPGKHNFIPYRREEYADKEMIQRSKEFYTWMDKRRTVREFSSKSVPREVMENLIRTASTAPSGAHLQPWTFCLISNEELKHRLRELAEEEEKKNYEGRMNDQWVQDLKQFGTTWKKEFLDAAPWLIVVMMQLHRIEKKEKIPNYYVTESTGIALGFLLAAIHNTGLVAVTHTPSPMGFLKAALNRPENERPFMVLPVGYPAEDATVPDIERKSLKEVAVLYEQDPVPKKHIKRSNAD